MEIEATRNISNMERGPQAISLRIKVGNRGQQVWGQSHPNAGCIRLTWYGLPGAMCLKQKQCLAYQRYSNVYDTKKEWGRKIPVCPNTDITKNLWMLNQIYPFLRPTRRVGRSASRPYFYRYLDFSPLFLPSCHFWWLRPTITLFLTWIPNSYYLYFPRINNFIM